MVDETAKVIFNLLASGESVYLNGVGKLTVRRKPAQKSSGKSIKPPYKFVVLESLQQGISLEEHLALIGNMSSEKAHEVYGEWLAAASHDGVIDISGVGYIENGVFTMDKEFESTLNPQGTAAVNIRRGHNTTLYVFAAICCIFAICTLWYVWHDTQQNSILHKMQSAQSQTNNYESQQPATIAAAETVVNEPPVVTDNNEATAIAAEQVESIPEETAKVKSEEVQRSVSGRSYVVVGVFSTLDNARRAAKDAGKKLGQDDIRTYFYSDKYMVSAFEADNRQECSEYLNKSSRKIKDLWIYTKK